MKMPLTHDASPGDRQLADYILGLLDEAATERLDEASVADDVIAARLRAVEDDMVDAYVRGTLAADRLLRFERSYLTSARRRDKVAFARNFVRAVDRASAAAPVSPAPGASASHRVVWRLVAVAAVLVIACGGLWFQIVRLGHGASVAEQERMAFDRRTRDLQQQVADLRAAKDAAVREAQHPAPAPAAPAIALVLLPQTRSVGPVPALVVPPRATRIAFELRFDSSDRIVTYQVGLRDPASNRVIWRSAWMTTAESSLTVSLPAGLLKPQHYSLDLFARSAFADPDVVGSYAFEVAAR